MNEENKIEEKAYSSLNISVEKIEKALNEVYGKKAPPIPKASKKESVYEKMARESTERLIRINSKILGKPTTDNASMGYITSDNIGNTAWKSYFIPSFPGETPCFSGVDPIAEKKVEYEINKDEELIINIEELADELAENEMKILGKKDDYNLFLEKYKNIILKHERQKKH